MLAWFPGAELDFHSPARPVNRTQQVWREILDREVREHEVPAVADQACGVCFAPFCLGLFPSLFASLAGDDTTGTYRHETTALFRLARLYRQIDDVSAVALEQPFKGLAGVATEAEGERGARQPPSSTAFDFNEFRKREVTHVPEHEVVFPNHRDELLADGLVLLGGGLEGVGGHLSAEQVVGEIELHSGGAAVSVAMGGEGCGVGFGHGLDRGVLHQNAADQTKVFVGKARRKTLPEEPVHHPGEESRGRLREASADRLAADGLPGSPRQSHRDLVVGGEPRSHRAGESLEEGRGVHFG